MLSSPLISNVVVFDLGRGQARKHVVRPSFVRSKGASLSVITVLFSKVTTMVEKIITLHESFSKVNTFYRVNTDGKDFSPLSPSESAASE